MIINLSKPRKEYFADATPKDILNQYINKSNVTVQDVQRYHRLHPCVIGTKEQDLDSLVDARAYTIDSLDLVERISSSTGRLVVLPPEYRIESEEVRQEVVYSLDTLVKLDGMDVRRALLGEKAPKGKLSAKFKQQEQWRPEKVIGAALEYVHEHKEEYAEKTLMAYSWFGKDNHRRIVSLYRAIQGAELRAFQDYAAFKLLVPLFRKELKTNVNSKTKEQLSRDEREQREEKIRRYDGYLRKHHNSKQIAQLAVEFSDLIEPLAIPFARKAGRLMRVPSRSKPGQTYKVQLTSLPLVDMDDVRAYSMVWDLRGGCVCEDKLYRSDRRHQAVDKGNDEDFFCAHEIAACHSVRKIQEKKTPALQMLPFVLPTKNMIDFVDTLRYNTILLQFNEATQRWGKHVLNHTEIENLLWKKVMVEGYSACFTTDISKFKEEKYDPHLDLMKFKQ